MGKSKGRSSRFNFTRSPPLTQRVRHESAKSESAQASFFSCLFALRVPSDTPQLRRAYKGDPLLAFTPQPDKALIGAAAVGGETFPLTKFSYRGNLVGGFSLRMPCFCLLGRDQARTFTPAHVFWKEVRMHVAPDQPPLRGVDRGNFNRTMEAVLARLSIPAAGRFSSQGIRRGAEQELKESGSPWVVVASAGVWNFPDFRGYFDMAKDVEIGVDRLFAIDQVSRSDAEQVDQRAQMVGFPPWPACPAAFPMGIGDLSASSGAVAHLRGCQSLERNSDSCVENPSVCPVNPRFPAALRSFWSLLELNGIVRSFCLGEPPSDPM